MRFSSLCFAIFLSSLLSACGDPVCGDGSLEQGEGCDDGNDSNTDACKNDCSLNICGDGVLLVGVEQCDDANTTAGDGCEPDCQFEAAGCGNSILDSGEDCDDG